MVAKIGHGENIMGALSYNQLKVQKENGEILFTHKMVETPDGNYSVTKLSRSFEPYLLANRRTEKPVLHISLNPDPKDKVSDEDFKEIAQQYMQQMGYGNQPFVVFKHTDIERTHIHIVSVCVDEEGRKIPDKFERLRSMDICRSLEQQYNLIPATEQNRKQDDQIFQPVDYNAGNIKSQIASVVRHLPKYYHFQSLGAYNALLSLFNITAEEVKGGLHSKHGPGITYFALNDQGEKISNPFKASLFGKIAGYDGLQNHYLQSRELLKSSSAKASLKITIEEAMNSSSDEAAFKQQLLGRGINTVVRRNAGGRIYGITFIDHNTKTAWNGSQMSKGLSANTFNEWWNNGNKEQSTTVKQNALQTEQIQPRENIAQPQDMFNFLDKYEDLYLQSDSGVVGALGNLLPDAQSDDYEERAFERRMKRRKKRGS